MFAVSNIAAEQQGKATVCGKMCGGGIYSTFSSDGTGSAIRIISDHVTENRHPLCTADEHRMCKAYGAKQQKPPRRLGCGAAPLLLVHTGVPVTRSSSSRCLRYRRCARLRLLPFPVACCSRTRTAAAPRCAVPCPRWRRREPCAARCGP